MPDRKTKIADKKKKRNSLLYQVAFLFLTGMIVIGVLGWYTINKLSTAVVENQKEELASAMAKDVRDSLFEYPAWEWLLKYWYDNMDSMDVEYDTEFKTVLKVREFEDANRGFLITDAVPADVEALPDDQKKVYAEIVYTWMLLRLNTIISAYDADYLSIVSADSDYANRTYLLSGTDGTKPRGSGDDDVYILGVEQSCNSEQQKAMKGAVADGYKVRKTENTLSRYTDIKTIDNRHVMLIASFKTKELKAEALARANQILLNFLVLIVGLMVLSMLLLYYLSIRPLEKIQRSIREYSDNRNSKDIIASLSGIRTDNEIGSLAHNFSEMIEEIDRRIEEISRVTAENERIGAELSIATQIQADLLPRIFPAFPERKEFDIYALMKPAKEVGGDFYDYFFIDDDHLALVIADVSEKGVPAALFMVISKTIIKNRAMLGGTPAEILKYANDQLYKSNEEGLFVTVWLAIIEISTGKGRAVNAGHEHPALRRADGNFELIKYRHSPMIAIREGIEFEDHEFVLNPGDTLFVYTDGVTEATDINDELFGTDSMMRVLNSTNGSPENVKGLLDTVMLGINYFVGEAAQFDDITMLGFNYYGPNGSGEEEEQKK